MIRLFHTLAIAFSCASNALLLNNIHTVTDIWFELHKDPQFVSFITSSLELDVIGKIDSTLQDVVPAIRGSFDSLDVEVGEIDSTLQDVVPAIRGSVDSLDVHVGKIDSALKDVVPAIRGSVDSLDVDVLAKNGKDTFSGIQARFAQKFFDTNPQFSTVFQSLNDVQLPTALSGNTDSLPNLETTVNDLKSATLEKFNQWYESDPRLQKSFSEYAADVLANDVSPKAEYLGNRIKYLTLERFDDWLKSDPRLQKSFSEYAADVLANDVAPKVGETADMLGRSPLAKSIQGLGAAGLQSIQAVEDVALDLTSSISASVSTVPTPSDLQLPSLEIDIPVADITDGIASTVAGTVTTALPAVARAGVRLGSEFGQAGKTLITNLGAGVLVAGKAASILATNAVKSPEAVVQAAGKAAPSIVDEAARLVTSSASAVSSTIDVTQQQLATASQAASKLPVFQESFWQEQAKTLESFKNLDTDAALDQAAATLSKAGERFVEIADRNYGPGPKIKAVIDASVQLKASGDTLVKQTSALVDQVTAEGTSTLTAVESYAKALIEEAGSVDTLVKQTSALVDQVTAEGTSTLNAVESYAKALIEEAGSVDTLVKQTSALVDQVTAEGMSTLTAVESHAKDLIEEAGSVDTLVKQTSTLIDQVSTDGTTTFNALQNYAETLIEEGDLAW